MGTRSLPLEIRNALLAEIDRRGLHLPAVELGTTSGALASIVLGRGRPSKVVAFEARWREREAARAARGAST